MPLLSRRGAFTLTFGALVLTTLPLAPATAAGIVPAPGAPPGADRASTERLDRSGAAASLSGSIVYIKAHNVWLARGDGTGQYQVTFDGTSAKPYVSPSQSDGGIIAVGHGQNIVRMRQNGTVLNRMNPPAILSSAGHPLDGTPLDVAISPNGKRIAWTFAAYQCPPGVSCGLRTATGVTDADRLSPASKYGTSFYATPSWVTNDRLLESGGYLHQMNLRDLGRAARHWFDDSDVAQWGTDLGDAELSPDGTRLAAVRGYGAGTQITWYVVNGNVKTGTPPQPPEWICMTEEMAGLADPTWSPDSRSMAWQEPDGVWLKTNPDRGQCGAPQPRLLIRGGSQPDWSAAAAKPAKRSLSVVTKPSVSGQAKVGKRLTARSGSYAPKASSVSYRWLRNGKAIKNASGRTYKVKKADRGKRLSVRVTAKRSGFTARTVTSKATTKVRR